MRTPIKTIAALATAAAMLAAAGCSGGSDDDPAEVEPPPDAETLLAAAADEMATVETVRLRLEADADLAGLPVRNADAVVTNGGEAEGVAQVEYLGQLVELRFVMVEDTFHYQLLGNWLRMPRADAASLYDPSAILDPELGVSNLLRNAQDPELTGQERVDGVEAHQVSATFAAEDLAPVLPGAPDGLPGTLWIGVDRPLLHQATFEVPGGTVTVQLSDFDEPVSISAP